jgi:uncharacterized protein YjiS (DUF1127 family)
LIARAEPRRAVGPHAPWLVAALDQILVWIERSKQRAQFASMEPYMLHDLGLSRADLDTECRKHFWER